MKKRKILYVTAEISPYASAGGLGEVGKSFPEALHTEGGMEIRRVMPLYRCINCKLNYVTDFPVPMGNGYETCVVKTDPACRDIPTYFIGNDRYFNRENIYSYDDDGLRFFFFCRAVIEMLKRIPYRPDLMHTNDWHTGFLPLLLKKEFPDIKSVYTIHNIAYQGYISASYLEGKLTGQEKNQLGYPEWLNFMKAGIIYSDLLTTVSEGYKNEIMQPEESCGMSVYLRDRQIAPVGIVNGIDSGEYNPMTDGVQTFPYGIDSLVLKKKNRSILREEFGLPDTDVPLAVMVTRLDYSKGIDLVIDAVKYLDIDTVQLLILGSGSMHYQELLTILAAANPGKIAVTFHYSQELAKRIYAAADIFLMPSLREPCGLGQLYAMRYGAVPIVYPVGGLKDTVIDAQAASENATGFYIEYWSGESFANAVGRAVEAFHSTDFIKYIANGMSYDSSWKRSVLEYRKYYELLF
jgi:starch synthase